METLQFFVFDRQFGPQQGTAEYLHRFRHPLPNVITTPQAAALHLIFQSETSTQLKTDMKKQKTEIRRMAMTTSPAQDCGFKFKIAVNSRLNCQEQYTYCIFQQKYLLLGNMGENCILKILFTAEAL